MQKNHHRRRRCHRGLSTLAVAVSAGLGSVAFSNQAAHATNYTWNNPAGGSWGATNPSNWNDGTVVPASDFNNHLLFNQSGSYATTADIIPGNSPFNLNSLTFSAVNATDVVGLNVSTNTNTLTFGPDASNSTPTLLLTNGSVNIQNACNFSAGSVITNSGSGNLILGAGGQGGLTFGDNTVVTNSGTGTIQMVDGILFNSSGTGILTLANPGGGTFSIGNLGEGIYGTLNIAGGPVTFAGSTAGNLLGNNVVLNVATGASFNFASNGETMGGISGGGNIIQGTAGITVTLPGNRTYNGVISGTGAFTQSNNGILTLGGQNTYTGATTINSNGTLLLTTANAIAKSSSVLVSAGTIDIGGNSQTFNNFSGANQTGALPLGGATLTLNTSAGVVSNFFSPLTGTGNVVITGSGTQALLGLNSFSGSTTVNGGTLQETYEGLLGSNGTITVASTAGLDAIVNNNVTYSLANATDNGAFVKDGVGTLTIATHSTNLNGTAFTINNGSVVLDHTNDNASGLAANTTLTIGSANLTLNSNAAATASESFASTSLQGSSQIFVNAGNQNTTIALGGLSRVAGFGATVNFVPVSSGTGVAAATTTTPNNTYGIIGGHATYAGTSWAVSGTGTGPFSVTPLPSSSYTANSFSTGLHTDVTSSFTVGASNISTGDIRFNAAAASTLTLNGTNTVSDGGILLTPNIGANTTTIAGGTALNSPANQDLIINQFNTQGALTVSSVISNTAGTATTLSGISLATTASTQNITVSSTAGLTLGELVTAKNSAGGTIVSASANAEIAAINPATNQVTLSYATAPAAATTGDTLTFTPGSNVVKSGPGTLNLSGNNTFKGVLYLNQGTLSAGVVNNYGSTSSGTASLYFNGGTLVANANFAPGSGLDDWFFGPAGGTINAGQNITITKYGNTLWGSGNLTLTGPGTFDVGSSASSYSGSIFINAGSLQLTSNQLKSVTGITVASGAQYHLIDTASGPFNIAPGASLILNGNGPSNTGAWKHEIDPGEVGSPNYAFNSAIVLHTTSRFNEQPGYNTGGNFISLTDNFPLPITGPGNLIKDGAGTLVLGSAYNTYGGANSQTIISNGTLRIAVNNGVPTVSTLQFGEAGSSNSGTFDLAGFNQTVAGLTSAGSGASHQIINSNSSQSVMTVNYNGTANQIFTNQIGGGTVGSPANNNLAFVKAGSGTLSLLGTTTYSGNATVAAGTLRVTGNAVSRGYSVADGATLIVANTDGTSLPATSLTVGNSGTSTLGFEFNGAIPTSGAIAVSNASGVTLNGTVNVAISSTSPLSVGQFPLITYTGSLAGSGFAAFNPTVALPSRALGHLVNDTSNSSIDLSVTGVDFLKWSGTNGNNWDINTTPNFVLNSKGTPTTYLDLPSPDTVVFDDSAAGSHLVNLTTTLNPASVTVNTAASYTFTGPGSINGSTGLTTTGTGTLNILTNNTYSGATTIQAGTVVVGNGGTTGSLGSGVITNNGALVFNRSDSYTVNPNLTGSGSLTVQGGGTLNMAGSLSAGSVSLSGGNLNAGAGTITGNVTGTGNLLKSGPGLLAIGGDVNTGSVNISGGTLQIGLGSTSGTLANNVTVANAALLGFNRSNSYTYAGAITGAGGVNVAQGTIKLTGNLSYSGPTNIGSNSLEFSSSAAETDLSGLITGTGTLISSGSGLLKVLNKDTGFTGNIIVNAGTMMLADEGARSDLNAGLITINSGGRFIFGEGGILGENPDLPDTTFISIQQGGTFELRVGEQYGATQLQGGTLLINGFGSGQGITSNAVTGPFLGFDLQSGIVMAQNTGTGVGTLTATNTQGAVNKTTPGTVSVIGPIAISSATPINITEGILSFQAINIPATGTAPLSIGNGPSTATLQLLDTGSASIARPVTLNSGAVIDLPAINGAGGSLTVTSAITGGGDLNLTGAGTLTLAGSNSYGNTNIAGGTLVLATTGKISSSTVSVNSGATFQLAGSTNNSAGILTRNLGAINLNIGGQVLVSQSSVHGNRQVVLTPSLSLSGNTTGWTSKVDLGNNDLIIANGDLPTVTSQLKQGYNGGTWNGPAGITSVSAASDSTHLTALGVILNSVDGTPNGAQLFGGALGQFDGQSPSSSSVLIKYTYYGDSNLDGKVDGSDYTRIDAGYLSQSTGWFNGDFNYDGVVDGSDYTLIDNAFNTQGAGLSAEIASALPTAEIASASGTTAVPEPATLGMLAIGAVGLLGRKRRF